MKTIRHRVLPLLVLWATALTACGEESGEATVPPEVLLERATAFRQACAAQVLERTAAENLALLESLAISQQPADPATGMTMPTNLAAAQFARGYHRHAELRAAAYALADSAVNHAPTPEDSIRYMERSDAFMIRNPQEGTIEANAMASFQTNFAAILSDDDHRCNWDIPGM